MSTEQPVPPSIPPRGGRSKPPSTAGAPTGPTGPTGHGAPTPASRPATPETGAAAEAPAPAGERIPAPAGPPRTGASPSAAATTAPTADRAPDEEESSPGRQESVVAGSRARAAAAGGAAAGAVRRAVRGATAAAVGAASGSSGTPASTGPGTTTGTGTVPRATQTEGDPAMAATDTAPRTGTARAQHTAPSGAPSTAAARDSGPRRVRLNLSRVDPWSVMKLSFLLSFAIGIMIVVAAVVVWFALDSLAVFTSVNDMITEIVGQESPIDVLQFLDLSRVLSGAVVVAVVDVVLLTALSTIGAFLYNITAALVGGVNVTLTDE